MRTKKLIPILFYNENDFTIPVRLHKGTPIFLMQISQGQGVSITPPWNFCKSANLCQQLHKVSHGNSFRLDISHKRASVSRPVLSLFSGAWEKRRLLCSASREKKGACVNSRHTRSQIEGNHQRATGQVDVPRPRTTSTIRIEQEGVFCSVLSAPPALRAVHKKNGGR